MLVPPKKRTRTPATKKRSKAGLRPYKFLIFAVNQRLDDNGNPVAEDVLSNGGKPIEIIGGVPALKAWADGYPQLLRATAAAANADAPSP